MELKENNNPVWNETILQHIAKHTNNYGIIFTEEEITQELEKITKGNPSRRCHDKQKCYEIFDKGKLVGDVALTPIDDDCLELNIAVFDDYADKGYAKKAIRKISEMCKKSDVFLEALVRPQSIDKGKMINILKKVGFKYLHTTEEGNEVYGNRN